MNEYLLNDSNSLIEGKGNFDASCKVQISEESLNAITRKALKIKIIQHGNKSNISNVKILIEAIIGDILIRVGNDNATVTFQKETTGAYDLALWRNSLVEIGEYTTSNGIRIVCDNSKFITGKDCMFSDNILIQSADQHGIIDLTSGKIINKGSKSVILGDHVWLGRKCNIMPQVNIGKGAIVGTGATVTKSIPAMSVAVGVPAKVIKSGITWSRFPDHLDDYSKKYLEESQQSLL